MKTILKNKIRKMLGGLRKSFFSSPGRAAPRLGSFLWNWEYGGRVGGSVKVLCRSAASFSMKLQMSTPTTTQCRAAPRSGCSVFGAVREIFLFFSSPGHAAPRRGSYLLRKGKLERQVGFIFKMFIINNCILAYRTTPKSPVKQE